MSWRLRSMVFSSSPAGLMQVFGGLSVVAKAWSRACSLVRMSCAEAGHFVGEPLVILLSGGDGGGGVAAFGLELVELGLDAGVAIHQRDAFGFELANLLLGRFDFALELGLEAVVVVDFLVEARCWRCRAGT